MQAEPNEDDLVDLEELELRKKLDELTDKISDKDLSSDDEDASQSGDSLKKKAVYSSEVNGASLDGLKHARHECTLEIEECVRIYILYNEIKS